jgi:glutathione S-transferase
MLRLVIGDKQLSSWSLRPWILLRHLGIPFEEVSLPLDTVRFRAEIERYSPARRVPVLLTAGLRVWDSLAICEYLNEHVEGAAWPDDPDDRALARSISAEMHSGFAALRSQWSLRASDTGIAVPLDEAGRADLARIDAIWSDCRARDAARGPWLLGGRYSIADAMYAPVVLRFNTYGASLSPAAQAYADHAMTDPNLLEWIEGARRERAEARQLQPAQGRGIQPSGD